MGSKRSSPFIWAKRLYPFALASLITKGPSYFGKNLDGPVNPLLTWSAVLSTTYLSTNTLSFMVFPKASAILYLYLQLCSSVSSLLSSSPSKSSHLPTVKTSFSFSFFASTRPLKWVSSILMGWQPLFRILKKREKILYQTWVNYGKPIMCLPDVWPNLHYTSSSFCWWFWWGSCLLLQLAYSLVDSMVRIDDALPDNTLTFS